jgi:hypothetical protein
MSDGSPFGVHVWAEIEWRPARVAINIETVEGHAAPSFYVDEAAGTASGEINISEARALGEYLIQLADGVDKILTPDPPRPIIEET